tara:strand:- start:376 stop:699 length:324 start_codon:yes stop_codon:yes gene_type:complete
MPQYSLKFLKKENDLNKILREQKRTKENINILFVSLWDDWCSTLVEKLNDEYGDRKEGIPLYVVDSFRMPHAFVIFRSQKLPHLVRVFKDKISSSDYLPEVYRSLKI